MYRSASIETGAALPYVYSCPAMDTILNGNDKLYVFCNPFLLQHVIDELSKVSNREASILQRFEIADEDNCNEVFEFERDISFY